MQLQITHTIVIQNQYLFRSPTLPRPIQPFHLNQPIHPSHNQSFHLNNYSFIPSSKSPPSQQDNTHIPIITPNQIKMITLHNDVINT
jgi:hypothetical protein